MNNIHFTLKLTALLNMMSLNGIFASQSIEDDGHGDLHRDQPVEVHATKGFQVEDDGHGDLHRDQSTHSNIETLKKESNQSSKAGSVMNGVAPWCSAHL